MAKVSHILDDAGVWLGASMNTVRRNPGRSAAVALTAVAGVALAGLARHFLRSAKPSKKHSAETEEPKRTARPRLKSVA
jgi:nucleoside recognition membrane protein YjiH